MIVVTIVEPKAGEDSAVQVDLRDDDGRLRQTARIAESAESWTLTVSIVTV